MKRRTKTIMVIASALGVAALAGGAWALTNWMDNSFHFAAAPATKFSTVEPTPVEDEDAAKLAAEKASKGLSVGAVLTADQAKAIGHYWQGAMLPYKMVDGTNVLIARDKPLPENVEVDAGKRLAASADAGEAASDPSGALIEQEKKDLEYTLGRKVSIVVHAYLALSPAFETLGRAWISTEFGGDQQYATADECLDAVHVKAGPDATIIVSQ